MTQLQFPPPRQPDPIEIAIAIVIVVSALGGVMVVLGLARAWIRRMGQPKHDAPELADLRDEVLGELQQVRHE
ncbi:MAG: hypothetical protein ACREN5_01795, partial [Gemmatimonadales bacterium]